VFSQNTELRHHQFASTIVSVLIAGKSAGVKSKAWDERIKLPGLGSFFLQTGHMIKLMGNEPSLERRQA
jgi:hypothetical protein